MVERVRGRYIHRKRMIEETVKVFLHASSLRERKNDFVLLDFFVVVDRSGKVFKSQRDIELLRKDTFESL